MAAWLIPALKAVLPHVGTIVSAAAPAFKKKNKKIRTGRAAAKLGRQTGGCGRHRGNNTPADPGALWYCGCSIRSVFMRCFVRDLRAVSAPSKHLLRMGACVARQSIKA